MKKFVSLAMATLMLLSILSLAGCSPATSVDPSADPSADKAEEPFTVAFLYNSSANDGGWTTGHDRCRQKLDEDPDIETTYLDNIPESDGWKYMNDFAKQGYDMVVATSYGYMQDCLDVASQNPDTTFLHCAGYLTADNMGNYYGRDFDATYLAGIAAGSVTESNVIGYVVPFPNAEVLRNVNAFAEGVKVSNPDAVVKLVWILTWYDPALEKEAAQSLIAAGADVLGAYLNSPSVVQTAEENGVYSVGSQADQSQYAPNGHLLSTLWNWDVVYEYCIEKLKEGNWTPESIWWGMPEGLVDISEVTDLVPQETRSLIAELKEKMIAGDETAYPFYSEVVDRDGNVRIEAGRSATLDELLSMDYVVANVEGDIPSA